MTLTGWEWTHAAPSGDALVERAARSIPGASLTRSKKIFGRFAKSAEGSLITDTDGKVYIDTMAALGAATLGYRPTPIGGVYSLPHEIEHLAAEEVLRDVAPWATWARFTVTGSESTHGCYRIAKATTGCQTVVALDGAYHGWHETWDTHVVREPYHLDPEQWAVVPESVAAVIVEPLRFAHMSRRWLQGIRDWCDRHGVLLVYDSMVYGGRFRLGGTTEFMGIEPDLETFGKALGGGASVAFMVGRERTKGQAEIPSGTYSGSVSGLAGVCGALTTYRTEPVIETLWMRGRQLMDGLRRVVPSELGIVEGHPPCHRIKFVSEAIGQRFCDAMLARGVILHPNIIFPMYSHTEQQIEQVIAAAAESARAL